MFPALIRLIPNASPSADRSLGAVCPWVEMGLYEALWVRPGVAFKSLATKLHRAPDSLPSAFVSREQGFEHAQRARSVAREATRDEFGIRIHSAAEYPDRLRDAKYPVVLLDYQGVWARIEMRSSRLVSGVGTRAPWKRGSFWSVGGLCTHKRSIIRHVRTVTRRRFRPRARRCPLY
jgi:hypothetical protein